MALPYQLHQKENQRLQNQKIPQALQSNNNSLDILKDKPFWIWDKTEHLRLAKESNQKCCMNHILSLPRKNNVEFPIFDYQKLIYDAIENNQNIFIKKARGIGVTTFVIRYLVWKILSTNELEGKSIFIISGTREEFANYVKKKMEDLFLPRFPNVVFDSKYTELTINKTWIKVMPTKNIKDVRGYMDVAYLFVDEGDWFDKSIQEELEPAITAYEEKSKGKTIMASTPSIPGGLFQRIEQDKNSKYKKLFLDYTYGLDKIYDRDFIAKKKLEREFPREYDLKYMSNIGNLLWQNTIDYAVRLGEQFSTKKYEPNNCNLFSCGVDPAFGSSAFAIVVTELIAERDIIRVVAAEQYENHPDSNDMVNRIFELHRKYWNMYTFID